MKPLLATTSLGNEMQKKDDNKTDSNETENGEIEGSGPGGWKVRLSGIDTKVVLVALLISVIFGVTAFQWSIDREVDKAARLNYSDQHKITQSMLSSVITNQRAIIDLVKESKDESRQSSKEMTNEISFMLSRTQSQREALKLEMPQSLRRKINERERDK